jgi:hypothetical protein
MKKEEIVILSNYLPLRAKNCFMAYDKTVANKELNDLYEIGGACSAYGEGRGAYGVLMGKPEGKRSLQRLNCRWKDNIKMDFQ